MGLFSLFKKDEDYEKILSSLEDDIKKTEKLKKTSIKSTASWSHVWVTYMTVAWTAYVAGFILYVWPDRHAGHAGNVVTHIASLVVIPIFIYQGNAFIKMLGRRSVNKHDKQIKRLSAELKEKLDELKKKTAFDTTKSLVDRYATLNNSGSAANSPQRPQHQGGSPPQSGPVNRLRLQQMQQDAKSRRRTMPNLGSGPTGGLDSNPGSVPGSPLEGKARLAHQQHQGGVSSSQPSSTSNLWAHQGAMLGSQSAGNSPVIPGSNRLAETGVVRTAARGGAGSASMGGASSRPWLDKLVDHLVGDVGGPEDKYALICRHCYAHNGLVLEEEIDDIQYTCPKCGKFNPSPRSVRTQKMMAIEQPPSRLSQIPDVRRQMAYDSRGLVPGDPFDDDRYFDGSVGGESETFDGYDNYSAYSRSESGDEQRRGFSDEEHMRGSEIPGTDEGRGARNSAVDVSLVGQDEGHVQERAETPARNSVPSDGGVSEPARRQKQAKDEACVEGKSDDNDDKHDAVGSGSGKTKSKNGPKSAGGGTPQRRRGKGKGKGKKL